VLDGPPQQLGRLVVVDVAQQDRVDLHRRQPLLGGRGQTGEHVVQPVATRDLRERVAADRVEAHVDAVEAGVGQRAGRSLQAERVGGERSARPGTERRRRADDVDQAAAYERLTAGEPDLVDTQPGDRDVDQPHDLGVGQHVVGGEPLEAFRGHAVLAAQVAPVSERHPEIGRLAAVTVHQSLGVRVCR
jgi:hypothetical protein